MAGDWLWIDDQRKMESARRAICSSTAIAVDTEYDSFRYFREKLCLVQIMSGKRAYLFDPLLGLDFSFLGDVFADVRVTKIMHAGDNDVRILSRDYGFFFRNIFDTYRAASLLGCQQLSLSKVVHRYLGIELEKSKKMQRSQWETRPLSEEQLLYAVMDTKHLGALYQVLDDVLSSQNLKEKAYESFAGVEKTRWTEKTLDHGGFMKIRGAEELNDSQLRRLEALYLWRFDTARRINRARFMILSDAALLDLSREVFDTLSLLSESGILSPQKIKEFGKEIFDTLKTFEK
ncbi:MAG: ribonuclease D [Deltaproteobacteria bacterium]|nr:ribonuclease D [Deltaproteobacteria bacterium]MBN2687966.1 ribonuclease D [Deltaproteobacteria bacterium]